MCSGTRFTRKVVAEIALLCLYESHTSVSVRYMHQVVAEIALLVKQKATTVPGCFLAEQLASAMHLGVPMFVPMLRVAPRC